jgi:hypothetical protein
MKDTLDWIFSVLELLVTAALIWLVADTLFRFATWIIAILPRAAADAAAVLSTVPVPQVINDALMLLTVVILLLTIKELLELRK